MAKRSNIRIHAPNGMSNLMMPKKNMMNQKNKMAVPGQKVQKSVKVSNYFKGPKTTGGGVNVKKTSGF